MEQLIKYVHVQYRKEYENEFNKMTTWYPCSGDFTTIREVFSFINEKEMKIIFNLITIENPRYIREAIAGIFDSISKKMVKFYDI